MTTVAFTAGQETLTSKAPSFSGQEASAIAEAEFGVTGTATQLLCERDQTFRMAAPDGREFVLKISNSSEDPANVDFQTEALRHVARQAPDVPVPRVRLSRRGGAYEVVTASDGVAHIVHMLGYLPGVLAKDLTPSKELLRAVGSEVARLGQALRGFFHPAARRELAWDLCRPEFAASKTGHIKREESRQAAEAVFARHASVVAPILPGLRAQVIHNDGQIRNLLVDPIDRTRISGIIDFGDLVHAPLVNDLAVAAAGFVLRAPDPLSVIEEILSGYHEVEPLREEEVSLVLDLTLTRLAMIVSTASWQADTHPENREYLLMDFPECCQILEQLSDADRDVALGCLRQACWRAGRPGRGDAESLDRTASDLEELVTKRRSLLGPTLKTFYDEPFEIVRGQGVHLIDRTGRAYLDAYNNVAQIGHSHPDVVDAIARQSARLNTNTRYIYRTVLDYAERLTATLPDSLEVCLFVNSGSEANDLAWRMAKRATGASGALVYQGAYHGATDAVSELSPCHLKRDLAPYVREVPVPDVYRGPHRQVGSDPDARYAARVDEATEALGGAGHDTAALIMDPILASSGIMLPSANYAQSVFGKVRAAGGLCIVDEVQTGFGRLAPHMWGFEALGVTPDLVTLGKPIGNGHPLGAVVTTREIAQAFSEQEDFFSTFGGNTVSCAVGLAVLEVIERDGLIEHAARVGSYLKSELEALSKSQPLIGDCRGTGLYYGVELVRDRETLEPAVEETEGVLNRMGQLGVMVGRDGLFGNVVKIRPPLIFSRADVDQLIGTMARALDEINQ